MIPIAPNLTLDPREITERFIRACGPGGQNVNKVATAVQLRFDIVRSRSLPDDVRARLLRMADRRVTGEGVLVITARRFRARERNRHDARARLVAWIRRATASPVARIATHPGAAAKRRRRAEKRHRSLIKQQRSTRLGGAPRSAGD